MAGIPSTPKNAKEIWDGLTEEMYEEFYVDAWPVIFESAFILEDATIAFDAGAHLAAEIACRASVELAGFVFLTSSFHKDGGPWRPVTPNYLDGSPRRVQFDEISRGLKARKFLSTEAVSALVSIQRNGNIIAHMGPVLDREAAKMWDVVRKRVRAGISFGDALISAPFTHVTNLIDPPTVLRDLRGVAIISLELAKAAAAGKDGPIPKSGPVKPRRAPEPSAKVGGVAPGREVHESEIESDDP